VSLIENDLAIFPSVNHDCEDFGVAYDGPSRQKIAQTKLQNINHIFFTIYYGDCSIEMIQIWVGQLGRNDEVDLLFEIVINRFLDFLYWQFWLEVSLPVKLSSLDETTDSTIFTSSLQNNTVSRYLLFVAENYDVADLYVL
jgi:hypothetical protein